MITKATISIAMVLLLVLVAPAAADTDIRPTVVVDYSMEPAVLMPGDTGTITISIENMADGEIYVQEDDKTFDMNAYIASIALGGNDGIEILNKEHTDIGLLGPRDTIKLAFNIRAKETADNGVHFLTMELVGGSDMNDLNYNIPVKIDDRNLKLILATMPTTVMNEISTIEIDIINTRPNEVTNVMIRPEGENVSFNPAEVFVGNIPAGNKSTVEITLNTMASPAGMKNLSFTASFFNGDNYHTSENTDLEINVVDQPSLIFTSIEVTKTGNSYSIIGDINNFGTTDAKNVLVSVAGSEDIKPVQPYANYFVGTLEADDFSSFELSARILSPDVEQIPILIEFRDTDNVYSSVTGYIDLESASAAPGNDQDTPIWMWGLIGVITIAIGGVIAYTWKKRKAAELEEAEDPDENDSDDEDPDYEDFDGEEVNGKFDEADTEENKD
ncbi:COG1361 S-layer family protein [Methanococcoides sp. FTZ1]|uniref:COG1361 S-layer family protein n=1 Tax=Methanococcoides sp. FTZ1 TaxID=3439061 RepID=UPI003F83391B